MSIKLHLGCGIRDFGKEWVHIDKVPYAHVQHHDVVNLPSRYTHVDMIYACHLLEYFDKSQATQVVKKWKKALKKGGILRLSVPDFDQLIKVYRIGGLSDMLGPLFGKWGEDEGEVIYHRMVWDKKTLTNFLYDLKFSDVREWHWSETPEDDHSRAHYPHDPEAIATQDFTGKIQISLNLEAIK